MTCIAGLVEGGRVWIGGDSAGICGWRLDVRADPKVFRVGQFVMGFTDSFRMGQLLAHAFKPPALPKRKRDVDRYMTLDFMDAARALFKEKGFATVKDGQEGGGSFMVGVSGRLYVVERDFQAGRVVGSLDAIGCGADLALGALLVTGGMKPEKRIRTALRAAERRSTGVRGPFRVVST